MSKRDAKFVPAIDWKIVRKIKPPLNQTVLISWEVEKDTYVTTTGMYSKPTLNGVPDRKGYWQESRGRVRIKVYAWDYLPVPLVPKSKNYVIY